MRMKGAKRQRPQQRLRLFQPTAAVAVNHDDALALDRELPGQRERVQRPIVVPANGLDRGDAAKLGESLGSIDIPRMKDQSHAAHGLEEAVREMVDELRTVRVRNDSDACGQAGVALDAGRRVRRTISGARLSPAASRISVAFSFI